MFQNIKFDCDMAVTFLQFFHFDFWDLLFIIDNFLYVYFTDFLCNFETSLHTGGVLQNFSETFLVVYMHTDDFHSFSSPFLDLKSENGILMRLMKKFPSCKSYLVLAWLSLKNKVVLLKNKLLSLFNIATLVNFLLLTRKERPIVLTAKSRFMLTVWWEMPAWTARSTTMSTGRRTHSSWPNFRTIL